MFMHTLHGGVSALHPYLVHYFDSSQPASLAGRPVLTPLAGRPVWGHLAGRPASGNLAGRPAGRPLWDTLAAWRQRDDKRRILLYNKEELFIKEKFSFQKKHDFTKTSSAVDKSRVC